MHRIAIIAFPLLLSSLVVAQAPQQTSAPGVTPQHQLMGYFAGDWTASGTSKISPKTPAAPFTLKEHGELGDGRILPRNQDLDEVGAGHGRTASA